MKLVRTDFFKEDYKRLPKVIQEKFDKKIVLFMSNIHHPSLRVKKMKGHLNRGKQALICSTALRSKSMKIITF